MLILNIEFKQRPSAKASPLQWILSLLNESPLLHASPQVVHTLLALDDLPVKLLSFLQVALIHLPLIVEVQRFRVVQVSELILTQQSSIFIDHVAFLNAHILRVDRLAVLAWKDVTEANDAAVRSFRGKLSSNLWDVDFLLGTVRYITVTLESAMERLFLKVLVQPIEGFMIVSGEHSLDLNGIKLSLKLRIDL